MNATKDYKRIDVMELLKNGRRISSEEALKDVVPFEWSREVLDGKKKVTISVPPKTGAEDV